VNARPSKRVPEDFVVADEMWAWAAEKFRGVNAHAETEAFRDHEYKVARSDWPAAWRTWMRNAAKFAASANGAGKSQAPRPTRYEQIFGKDDVVIVDG
jgi:hypothetical protein